MPGLRETLEAAMPGPWVADEMLSDPGEMHNVWRKNGSGYVAVAHDIAEFDDARLIALAPELAALCLDMGDYLRDLGATRYGDEPGDVLLARLDRIGKED